MPDDSGDNPNKFQPKSLILKVGIFIVVLVVGAAIFQAIEKQDVVDRGKSARKETITNLTLKYNMTEQDVVKLVSTIKDDLKQEELASKPQWTLSNSVFLSFSIMTTIGYGHLTPKTSSGQVFCIIFSLVAIPVTGIMLISVGSHVALALQLFITLVEKKIMRREVQVNTEVKSAVVTFVFMILIIIFGALLTRHTDGWTFVEGMYFTFISLSTIGFGDYVINDGELNDKDQKKAVAVNFTIVLITIGLCVVSSVLCSVSSVIEEKQKRMREQLHLSTAAVPGRMALSAVNKFSKVGKSNATEKDTLTNEEKI